MQITEKVIASNAIIARHLSTAAKEAVLGSKFHAFPVQVTSISAGTGSSVAATDKIFSAATNKKTGGSSSIKGVITATPNNKAEIRDQATDGHVTDSSDRQVYGRVSKTDTALTGTAGFTNGSTAVSGSGSAFTTELVVGDYIKNDADGSVGKVASIESDTALTLTAVYPGATGSGAASKVVLTLSFYVGADIAHSMASQTIDVLYAESVDLQAAPFAAFMAGAAFAEALPAEHDSMHDDRFFTETELGASTGAALIGASPTGVVGAAGNDVQEIFTEIARKARFEKLTIATQNVLPDLTYTPREAASVKLIVEGVQQRYGASYDYTYVVKVGTWSAANAGFDLDPGDEVWASYDSSD